jgi:hypothetical protein
MKPIMKEGIRVYSPEEINEIAEEAGRLAVLHTGIKSKWSGNVVIDPVHGRYGKEWNCDISTPSETAPHILLHEQLHALLISYFDNSIYQINQNMEEAVVQLMAQEISAIEEIEVILSSYDDLTDALRALNKKVSFYASDYEFAKKLLAVPVPERLSWLENEVYDKMQVGGTIEDYQELAALIDLLR